MGNILACKAANWGRESVLKATMPPIKLWEKKEVSMRRNRNLDSGRIRT